MVGSVMRSMLPAGKMVTEVACGVFSLQRAPVRRRWKFSPTYCRKVQVTEIVRQPQLMRTLFGFAYAGAA